MLLADLFVSTPLASNQWHDSRIFVSVAHLLALMELYTVYLGICQKLPHGESASGYLISAFEAQNCTLDSLSIEDVE